MAKQMSYTTDSQLVCPQSYWVCSRVNIDMLSSVAHIEFTGWSSPSAALAGASPVGRFVLLADNAPAVGTNKKRTLFDDYFSPAALDAAGAQVSFQGYKFATEQSPFFSGAIDVP